MNMYKAMFCRKSIRKYKMEMITQESIRKIVGFQAAIEKLYPDIPCEWQIISSLDEGKNVRGLFKVNAPYFMIMHTEKSAKGMLNAGYMMEQMVLYLILKGIGSCYQGMLKVQPLPDCDLVPVLVLAFGYPEENLLREWGTAKRKGFKDICILKEDINESVNYILNAAIIAPSAMNRQPWRFVVYNNKMHIYKYNGTRKPFHRPSGKEFIDIGIVISHIVLAAEEKWMNTSLVISELLVEKELKNHTYVTSILLEDA